MKNTQKHTDGPWHYRAQNQGQFIIETPDKSIAWLDRHFAPSESDARLIASAPDLLQVTKDLLLLAALHDWEGAAIDFAKATLAKAEGGK